ncbi:hypothetical protein DSCO28_64350 [Desulfosarcina ovata subsp. sediminis]|uniref:Uncharacterized protein n=1 Tax=Desulfosarcina ovata subsp. sediminis TaxID=885957 RepID=A0A5K8A016_9BACT|nr:hypothetical protein DSCO28_64350 [Desulfosarcina ovata subsp. sediminis]
MIVESFPLLSFLKFTIVASLFVRLLEIPFSSIIINLYRFDLSSILLTGLLKFDLSYNDEISPFLDEITTRIKSLFSFITSFDSQSEEKMN